MKKYCFLDVETTGLEPKDDSLIEIAYIIQDETGKTLKSYDQIIFPEKTPLTPHVSHITGITEEIIQKEGVAWKTVKEEIQKDIEGCIIVGHNIDFDLDCMVSNGLNVDRNDRIDTHELSRILLCGETSYSLEILAKTYGFLHTEAHRALSDVEASRDLFWFLLEKIKELPASYLSIVKNFLETQKNWLSRDFFLAAEGTKTEQTRTKTEKIKYEIIPNKNYELPEINEGEPLYIEGFDTMKSAETLKQSALALSEKGKKVILVTPKIAFFPEFSPVPTPEVLIDPVKLNESLESNALHGNRMVCFLLKCAYRHYLGYRGMHHFDLFYLERDYWKSYNLSDTDSPYYQAILTEKLEEEFPCMTPLAYFQLQKYLSDRVLIIDEGEQFSESLLHAPTHRVSFDSVLDSQDDNISVKAHFWVSSFCQEVLQPILKKSFGPFPERILFPSHWTGEKWFGALEHLSEDPELKKLKEIFNDTSLVRWAVYYPEKGRLLISWWDKQNWKTQKESLSSKKIILHHRHRRSQSNAFFRIWMGLSEGRTIPSQELEPAFSYEVDKGAVSLKSPEYNDVCAQKIYNLSTKYPESPSSIIVASASIDTIRKTALKLDDILSENESNYKVIGERLTGGKGKMLQMIQSTPQNILFIQKITDPSLSELNVNHIFLQKFPFPAPDPLLDALKPDIEVNGLSMWDLWTIPQVATKISQTLGIYNKPETTVTILDPRHNSGWARNLLRTTFSNYF